MRYAQYILPTLLLTLILATGCRDKDECEDAICYEVPTSYSFDNVSYSGQTERLNMLEEMTIYMKTANDIGVQISAQTLKDMFANENDPFSFTSTKQLKNKCFALDVEQYEDYMDKIEVASQSATLGSNGMAGVVESNDGSKAYLFDENGIEYTQLIEKGLMGAVFYYQTTAVYLSDDKIGEGVDNTTITEGEGTDMQHHWDEGFGYFGVPADFPDNVSGIRFHGKYANGRDPLLNCNETLMDAFILGRAAINNNDHDTKEEQVEIIRNEWEEVIAATAIHYLNSGVSNIADDALRNHALSEAIAFTMNLEYNPTRRITDAQISSVLQLIGGNLYEASITDLNAARDLLSEIYGFDSIKTQL